MESHSEGAGGRFRTLTSRVVDGGRVERILKLVLKLEELENVADLMKLCVR